MNNQTAQRLQPQNVEAEMSVLSAMMIDGDRALDIMDILVPDDFYDKKHEMLYEIVASMYDEGQKVDLVTLSNRLEKFGMLDKVGGASYLTSMITAMPSVYNAVNYAKIVKSKSQLRKIINKSNQITYGAYEEKLEVEPVVELEMLMNGLLDSGKKKSPYVKDVMKEMQSEISDYEDGKVSSVSTGFPGLDKIVDGFIVPHIWIIGGFTGTGKTFFTLNLLKNLMRNGDIRPVLFSTENKATRNLIRMLGCMTGFHEMKLFKGRWTPEEKERIEKAKKELDNFPLTIYDNVFTTQELRLKAKKHKMKDGANLIVVDYIQQLNEAGDIYQQMSNVSMELQRIANELQMGVIGVSQIGNAEVGKREQVTVNFKGAGEIRAISDVGMLLRSNPKERHKLIAEIVKVRHGVPGRVIFDFFGEEQKANGTYIEESKNQ